MAGDDGTWIWAADPENVDCQWVAFFQDFFDHAIKDADGFYSEQIPIGVDGRLSPDKRVDGSLSLLPACFHQLRLRSGGESEIATRGPTVEEFYRLLAKLQDLMPGFEFVMQEDPHRRWVRYRARR